MLIALALVDTDRVFGTSPFREELDGARLHLVCSESSPCCPPFNDATRFDSARATP
jgi:hypothetical protein